jgi:hypothetical protein
VTGLTLMGVSKSMTDRPYIGRSGSSQAALIVVRDFGVVLVRLSTGLQNGQDGTRRGNGEHPPQQAASATMWFGSRAAGGDEHVAVAAAFRGFCGIGSSGIRGRAVTRCRSSCRRGPVFILREYLSTHRAGAPVTAPLFVVTYKRQSGQRVERRISGQRLWKLVNAVGTRAGIPALHPHALRHARTVELLRRTKTSGSFKNTYGTRTSRRQRATPGSRSKTLSRR